MGVGAAAGAIGAKLGGALGTFLIPIPGVGTAAGVLIGAGLGFIAGALIDGFINADIFCGGTKSAMDVVKDWVFDGVCTVKQFMGLCPVEG